MTHSQDSARLDDPQRISRLEASVEALTTNVQGLLVGLREHSRHVDEQIMALSRDFQARLSSSWPMMLTGISLIFAVGGAAVGPLYVMLAQTRESTQQVEEWQTAYGRGQLASPNDARLAGLEARLSTVQDTAVEHYGIDGHAGVLQRVAVAEKERMGLETALGETQRRVDHLETHYERASVVQTQVQMDVARHDERLRVAPRADGATR